MRLTRILHDDQELTTRFLAVLGQGLGVAGQSKLARPGFFVFAGNFIHEYLEPVYFRKEEVLLDALEECGFSAEDGPVGNMHRGQQKSREVSKVMQEAAKAWMGGDEVGRAEVIYATSEYTGVLHRHFDTLRSLIHPLLEQYVTPEGEEKAAEALNRIAFEADSPENLDRYVKMVEMLEEELNTWK